MKSLEIEIREDCVRVRLDNQMYVRFNRANIQRLPRWIPSNLRDSVLEVLRREGWMVE